MTFPFSGVDSAQWRPLYDLYTFSQDGKPSTSVSLHYRVNLSQGTGEDWDNAKLILSTSETDILNAGVPTSGGLVVEPKPKPPPSPPSSPSLRGAVFKRKKKAKIMTVESSICSESDYSEYEELEAAPSGLRAVLSEMSEGGAIISKTPMAVNYTVNEPTTIPSDDESHKVLVTVIPFEATISHITTPRKSPLAYLQVWPRPVSAYHLTYRPTAYSAR